MAKLVARQTLRGKYGKVGAGEEFELSKKDGQKLVDKGVAEFVDDTEDDDSEESTTTKVTEPVSKTEKATIKVRKEKNDQAGPAGETRDSEPIIS